MSAERTAQPTSSAATTRGLPPQHGMVARVLHWLTVLALLGQYLVGYAMTGSEGLLEPWVDEVYDGDEDLLLPVHVAIGCSILALTAVRFTLATHRDAAAVAADGHAGRAAIRLGHRTCAVCAADHHPVERPGTHLDLG